MPRKRTDLSGLTEEQKAEHRREKWREKTARWRENNRDKHRQQARDAYWADPETARAKNRERLKAHPEYQKKRAEYNAWWHRQNRANNPKAARNMHLKSAYGISQSDYDRMLVEQGGKCKTCFRTPDTEKHGVLHVDHCHDNGNVRGLLCHRCNTGLGLSGHSVEQLERWLEFLKAAGA